jgi:hypothetical protein
LAQIIQGKTQAVKTTSHNHRGKEATLVLGAVNLLHHKKNNKINADQVMYERIYTPTNTSNPQTCGLF